MPPMKSPFMRRRAFLVSALTAASTIAAGCSAIDSETEHTDPKIKTDDNPRDDGKYLEFREDGQTSLILSQVIAIHVVSRVALFTEVAICNNQAPSGIAQ